jgi:hypothetical protein
MQKLLIQFILLSFSAAFEVYLADDPCAPYKNTESIGLDACEYAMDKNASSSDYWCTTQLT